MVKYDLPAAWSANHRDQYIGTSTENMYAT